MRDYDEALCNYMRDRGLNPNSPGMKVFRDILRFQAEETDRLIAALKTQFMISYEAKPEHILGRFEPVEVKCECGAEKTGVEFGAAGHSAWCPAKEKV